MPEQTFHVRRKLPPKGGNQFYRGTRQRAARTFCGAAATDHDVRAHEKATIHTPTFGPSAGTKFVPCEKCMISRKAFRAFHK